MIENPCGINNVDHRFDVVHFDVLAATATDNDTGTGVAIRITGAPGGAKKTEDRS
ncbi:hypothetical protein [Mycobacteroides abscessus]|uniref:Uncharacterized protein n=1 Tax=Mycobacteroides abscessus TaxID=36809 RepID=A0A0U0ZQY9_9MYCO|nr:hypothetical protein [Mycobacteroides abscessus]CPV66089.1 Uncharacterised protein [Mycobacteroides abscessus]